MSRMVLEVGIVDTRKLETELRNCLGSFRHCVYRALALSSRMERLDEVVHEEPRYAPCWIVIKAIRHRVFIVYNPRLSTFFVVSQSSVARVSNLDDTVDTALKLVVGPVRRVLLYTPSTEPVKVRISSGVDVGKALKSLVRACFVIASYSQPRVGSSRLSSSHSHHVERYR